MRANDTPTANGTDPEQPQPARARDWSRPDWIAIAIVTLVAAVLRLWNLANPDELVFDETYYAKDACWYVESDQNLCDLDNPQEITQVHPPLGKWILAAGVRVFGYDSFGWRIGAALAGIATVALVYLLARKLLHSTLGATLASGLLAIDFLHFVQSRTAMLDVFVPLFGVAAFLGLAYDRNRLRPRLENGEDPPPKNSGLFRRPWRIAAGAAAGAAFASKWSGALVLLSVLIVAFAWEVRARRGQGTGKAIATAIREEGLSIAVWLVVLPLAVYVTSYIGRIDGATLLAAPWSEESWFRALWERQLYMRKFHTQDLANSFHSYQSPPWSWLLLKRPVAYAYCSGTNCNPAIVDTDVKHILALGSPFVWWASLLALLYTGAAWIRRRNPLDGAGLILAGFGFSFLPWLFMGLVADRGAVFIFYALPAVPFMCLALGYVATRIGDSWEAKASVALFSTGAAVLFAFYHPVLSYSTMSRQSWEKRLWLFDGQEHRIKFLFLDVQVTPEGGCQPRETEITKTVTETVDGVETASPSVTTTTESVPPKGWCWI